MTAEQWLTAIGRRRKAIVGFLAPGVPLLIAAFTAESPGGSSVTAGEWAAIAGARLISGAGVYPVPYTPAPTDE